MNTTQITVGSRVVDRWQEPGVVIKIHDDATALGPFVTLGSLEAWLEAQAMPIPKSLLFDRWATVACDTGGQILSPVSLLADEAAYRRKLGLDVVDDDMETP